MKTRVAATLDPSGSLAMLKNYVTVTLRNLRRHPGYTLINVGGLGLGLACCFLIVLFVQHERSYDRFHERGDRIFRLTFATNEGAYANSAAGYAPRLVEALPEVEQAVRVENFRAPMLRLPDGTIRRLEGLVLADSGFFQVFSFPLLRGDPARVLDGKYDLVLTESVAEAFFGTADPVGQPVQYGAHTLTVTGVAADAPVNSHLQFGAVAAFPLVEEFQGEGELTGFTNYNYTTYLLLRTGADPGATARKATDLGRRQFDDPRSPEALAYTQSLQPLRDIRFSTGLAFNYFEVRDRRYLWIFGAIGLLILLIACVNFMNLVTARAANRAREVGVRKVVGAYRGQLVGQFLGESVLLSVVAIAVGMALAGAALPFFNEAMGAAARFDPGHVPTLLLLVGIGLGAGLVAGSYPALYLSAFRPVRVLKGASVRTGGAPLLRKGLIVGQFAISAFLIVATLTVHDQLRFMQGRDLGFEKAQVVSVVPPTPVMERYDAFRQELLTHPGIAAATLAGGLPGRTNTSRGYNWPGRAGADEQGESFWTAFGDPYYLDVLDIDLIAGRAFSEAVPTDTNDTYLLNETAVRRLGWTPDEAVGQPFRAWDRPMGQVIGVVKDFHFQSLHAEIEPLVINYKPEWMGNVAVRLTPGAFGDALDHIEAVWRQFAPGYTFAYRFLDADFDRLYRDEVRLGRLFLFFAGIAVFIACLGLLGLAAYTASQRRKEIGIRKVMGASEAGLVALLTREFALLVGAGLLVAAPAAYVAMSRWLEAFAYRITLGPQAFAWAGVLVLGFAFLTVSVQAYRAATANPVDSLRYE